MSTAFFPSRCALFFSSPQKNLSFSLAPPQAGLFPFLFFLPVIAAASLYIFSLGPVPSLLVKQLIPFPTPASPPPGPHSSGGGIPFSSFLLFPPFPEVRAVPEVAPLGDFPLTFSVSDFRTISPAQKAPMVLRHPPPLQFSEHFPPTFPSIRSSAASPKPPFPLLLILNSDVVGKYLPHSLALLCQPLIGRFLPPLGPPIPAPHWCPSPLPLSNHVTVSSSLTCLFLAAFLQHSPLLAPILTPTPPSGLPALGNRFQRFTCILLFGSWFLPS